MATILDLSGINYSRRVSRTERKLLGIVDRLARLRKERGEVAAELEYHRHIHDDAVRDAVLVEDGFDKMEAGATGADVRRFSRRLEEIDRSIAELEERRIALLQRLE